MKSLLIVAHGSRREESNTEIIQLVNRVASKAEGHFDIVEYAFLELAKPSIPSGIENCLQRGATSIRVLPYFLAQGTHVAEGIPQLIAKKKQQHPAIDIQLTEHLGAATELVDVLLRLAH